MKQHRKAAGISSKEAGECQLPPINGSTVIDMSRVTAPIVPSVEKALRASLSAIQSFADLPGLMREHRYSGTRGDREAGAAWLSRHLGTSIGYERVILTHGTLNAVQIAVSHLLGEGGTLFTEELTYPQIPVAVSLVGSKVHPVKMDNGGLLPDVLDRMCRDIAGQKALYCVPTLQNPTTATMSIHRRQAVIDVARRHNVRIIEDDAQGLIPTDVPPPFVALAPDITWYVVALSKIVSMGLRIAILVAPSGEAEQHMAARFRRLSTWWPSPLSAMIATRWLSDGTADRILHEIRVEARNRQAIAWEVLNEVDFAAHPNGLHLWVRPPGNCTVQHLMQATAQRGLILRTGGDFLVDQTSVATGVRVALSDPSLPAMRRGLKILASI